MLEQVSKRGNPSPKINVEAEWQNACRFFPFLTQNAGTTGSTSSGSSFFSQTHLQTQHCPLALLPQLSQQHRCPQGILSHILPYIHPVTQGQVPSSVSSRSSNSSPIPPSIEF